jgi:hypothetical protein
MAVAKLDRLSRDVHFHLRPEGAPRRLPGGRAWAGCGSFTTSTPPLQRKSERRSHDERRTHWPPPRLAASPAGAALLRQRACPRAAKANAAVLAPDQSATLRERLLGEIASITEADTVAAWARGCSLPRTASPRPMPRLSRMRSAAIGGAFGSGRHRGAGSTTGPSPRHCRNPPGRHDASRESGGR